MFLLFIKYIISVIALASTLLFISDVISSIVSVRDFELARQAASLRIILIIIMSLTWPLIFLI